jgi:hypothetical protein
MDLFGFRAFHRINGKVACVGLFEILGIVIFFLIISLSFALHQDIEQLYTSFRGPSLTYSVNMY